MATMDQWAGGRIQPVSTPMHLTFVTETSVIVGTSLTWRRRMTDLLNEGDHRFVLLEDVVMRDVTGPGPTIRAEHAQVNLDAVLFAVADAPVVSSPDFHVRKAAERAYISIPPYVVVGHVHLHSGEGLRDGLEMLVGRFVPVTDVVYWSASLGIARTEAEMVAVNHERAQILLPFEAADDGAGPADSGSAAGDDSSPPDDPLGGPRG